MGTIIIARKQKTKVYCPFCGRYFVTLGHGEAESECNRCHNYLIAINDEKGFRLFRNRRCTV